MPDTLGEKIRILNTTDPEVNLPFFFPIIPHDLDLIQPQAQRWSWRTQRKLQEKLSSLAQRIEKRSPKIRKSDEITFSVSTLLDLSPQTIQWQQQQK